MLHVMRTLSDGDQGIVSVARTFGGALFCEHARFWSSNSADVFHSCNRLRFVPRSASKILPGIFFPRPPISLTLENVLAPISSVLSPETVLEGHSCVGRSRTSKVSAALCTTRASVFR